jgi:ABC-type multidrug transport system fused ATPase/permease subunit
VLALTRVVLPGSCSVYTGQKARVALARACYSSADIMLFDDPLSAVDSHVGEHLMGECFHGLLHSTTRVLVTNQVQYLSKVSHVVVIDRGAIVEQGSYKQLAGANGAFAAMLDGHGDEKPELRDSEAGGHAGRSRSSSCTRATGETRDSRLGSFSDDGVRGSDLGPPVLRRQMSDESARASDISVAGDAMEDEKRVVGSVAREVLAYYIAAGGKWLVFGACFISAGQIFLPMAGNLVLAEWVQATLAEQTKPLLKADHLGYISKYSLCSAGMLVCGIVGSLMFACARIAASKVLHERLLHSILRCTFAYFDTTPIGRVLNYFGNDVKRIDEDVMQILMWCSYFFIWLLSTIVVITAATRGTLVIVLVPVGYCYVTILNWIRMSKTEVQRIDAITKAPVVSSFSETVAGVVTIRAYSQQQRFIIQNQRMVNTNNRAAIPQEFIRIWLNQRLGVLGAVVCAGTCAAVVVLHDQIPAGQFVGFVAVHLHLSLFSVPFTQASRASRSHTPKLCHSFAK